MLHKTNTEKEPRKSDFVRVRLAPEKKRKIRMILADQGGTFQSFFERGLELALAQADRGKN